MNELKDRQAQCTYCKGLASSNQNLPFFEYQGPGSNNADQMCSNCSYHLVTHLPVNPTTGRPGTADHEFSPRGDVGYDRFYCGCRGWN